MMSWERWLIEDERVWERRARDVRRDRVRGWLLAVVWSGAAWLAILGALWARFGR
jgi:hypothetical protein